VDSWPLELMAHRAGARIPPSPPPALGRPGTGSGFVLAVALARALPTKPLGVAVDCSSAPFPSGRGQSFFGRQGFAASGSTAAGIRLVGPGRAGLLAGAFDLVCEQNPPYHSLLTCWPAWSPVVPSCMNRVVWRLGWGGEDAASMPCRLIFAAGCRPGGLGSRGGGLVLEHHSRSKVRGFRAAVGGR